MTSPILNKNGKVSIHFEVDDRIAEILVGLAKHRNLTVNGVAQDIVMGWVSETWRKIERGNKPDLLSN